MDQYIVFLRGINVSGQKLIKMAELRGHLEKVGFKGAQTYVQSGNLLLSKKGSSKKEVEEIVKRLIMDIYSWEVPTLAKTKEEIESLLKSNPFFEKGMERDRCYYTLLNGVPDPEKAKQLEKESFPPEEYILEKDTVFFYSPKGYGKAKMNNNFFEKKLGVQATTRNVKTMEAMVRLAEK